MASRNAKNATIAQLPPPKEACAGGPFNPVIKATLLASQNPTC